MAVVAIAAVLTGCGGSTPERADTVPGPSPGGTGQDGDQATQRQIESALLTTQDMPTGWTSVPLDDADASTVDRTDPAHCAVLFDDWADDAIAKAEVAFGPSGGGDAFGEVALAYRDRSAVDEVQRFADAINQCPQFTATTTDGITVDYEAAPLSFPNLGDRTLALSLRSSAGGSDYVLDMIWVAMGQYGLTLVGVGLDGNQLEQLSTAAVDRLTSVIG
jgi:hypothetical protein